VSHASRVIAFDGPLELKHTLGGAVLAGDPTRHTEPGAGGHWRATWTPEGSATIRVRKRDQTVSAEAWGDGAGWVLARTPAWLGLDRPWIPTPDVHPTVTKLARRFDGIRIGRTFDLHADTVQTILGQKVTAPDAAHAKRELAKRFGCDAPGPDDGPALRLLPTAQTLAKLAYFEMHPCRIERKRAEIIRTVSKRGRRFWALREQPPAEATTALQSLRGIGPWTAGVLNAALGDEDALVPGDYHLPNLVAWMLAGEDRADDARMIELLRPFRPVRHRVLLLLHASGQHAPRYGPKMTRLAWR
jgi:3-methyladenine DNA glycosylase/8-oxoguanine DNA glycosylase